MKVKTSVTLSEDLLRAIDRAVGKDESRSEVIERLLAACLAARDRQAAERRDLQIINERADQLNAEAEDVLGYQVDV